MRVNSFKALRPSIELADQVAAVPYDTVDTEEARALADGNPYSLLRVSRPEIEFSRGTDIYSDKVYDRGLENFLHFREKNYLVQDACPGLFVYRLEMKKHVQFGIVGCCSVADYENNIIKKHEKTRADKENDRTRHTITLRANTGPVFLAYRDATSIDRLVKSAIAGKPVYDFTAVDGIKHTVWRMPDAPAVISEFNKVPVSYIADGHHRAASAARACAKMREENKSHDGTEEYNWFLAVLFPASQLQIMPYNRCVADLNGLDEKALLEKIKKSFTVTAQAKPSPAGPGMAGMYLGGKWFGLQWKNDTDDPVLSLDVSYLQAKLLDPVLGIKDPRTDKRIDFIGGIRGTDELVKRVDSGKAAVAFSMYPVTVEQVMAIADAGMIMPPKSTWFEPKLRSGLLVHAWE